MGGQPVNTGSSMGKMLITMLAGFAEFERNMIAERTTAALRHKKAHGEVYNHVPFGFMAEDGNLIPNATEQAVIARMQALRAEGTSYNAIANGLMVTAWPRSRAVSGVRRPSRTSFKPPRPLRNRFGRFRFRWQALCHLN